MRSGGFAAGVGERHPNPFVSGELRVAGESGGCARTTGMGVHAVHRSDGRAVSHARDLALDDERCWDLPDRPAHPGRP